MSYGNKKQALTKKQIALLHVAKSRLGLQEGDYRAILSLYGGAESAKDLTLGGFERVMRHLQQLGFDAPAYHPPRRSAVRNAGAVVEPPQAYKIEQLFADLGIDTAERRQGLCRRVIKKPWAQTRADANKVIECLKAMLRRRAEAQA